MKVLKGDIVVCYDVDDTLISIVETIDEHTLLAFVEDGFPVGINPIECNIEALKRHKRCGQKTVVWSRGGHKWACAVIKALQLEEYVDVVMCKPMWYYDDIPASKWMGEPRWGGDRK